MKIKPGAVLNGLKLEMRKALITADKIWKDNGVELVITAGLDGEHSAGSLHYFGYAVDCRTNYFDEATKKDIAKALKQQLGHGYDVVVEATHIHVEYDEVIK